MTLTRLKAVATTAAAALFVQGAFAQEECSTAVPITDGMTAFDTTGAIDEGVPMNCGSGPALDIWYSYVPSADGDLNVSLCGSGFDTRLEIYDTCGGTLLGCNDDSCGLQSELTVAVTTGADIRIRVTGWNGANGAGTVTVDGPVLNDDCITARDIAVNTPTTYDTTPATPSAEPWACTGNTTIRDLWFTFTATADYMASATTCNTASYDTRIEVFDGACGALNSIACNDDFAGCAGFSSQADFMAVNGTQYWVRVGGFSTSSFGVGDLLVTGPPPAVPNDECFAAIEIFNLVAEPFDNSAATNSAGAPAWSCGGTSANALDIWYLFTPAADGPVIVDTEGSSFDTRLEVYEGTCGSLVSIDCDDDGGTGTLSSISFMGTAGTTYYARVAGFSGFSGMGQITAEFLDMVPNDDCGGAIPIGEGITLYNNEAGTDSGVGMTCGGSSPGSNDLWYSYFASADCPVTVDLSGSDYDTVLTIYEGDCMNLVEIDCDDDGGTGLDSLISFNAMGGTTYLIQVGGFGSSTGDGIITLTEGLGSIVCLGEPNSTGVGAELKVDGSLAVADNNMILNVTNLPANAMGYFVHSMETFFIPNPGGSMGNLCIASFTMGRFAGNVLDSGSGGSVSFTPDLNALPVPTGFEPAMAGETRYFQYWTRDAVGGMSTSNFSSAVCVTFL